MSKVYEEDQAEDNKQGSTNQREVVAPEDEEWVGDCERYADKDKPEEYFGAPPTILDGSAFVAGVSYANKGETQERVEKTESKADTVDCKNTITLVVCAVHLDVVIAPFLDEFDGSVCTHDPC